MSIPLADRADSVGHVVRSLLAPCKVPRRGVDGMILTLMMAGVFVETVLLFEDSDAGLEAVYDRLAVLLGCEPMAGPLGENVLPPPDKIDATTEMGRSAARGLFAEWLACPYDFFDIALEACHHLIVAMEEDGIPRAESFRMLIECANRCLAYEISAQELCDIVIDQKIGAEGWSLTESISGLSAVAGRALALSFKRGELPVPPPQPGRDLHAHLDKVAYVMTQEAIRLGIPAGSDWRFGLAANDQPGGAPYELIATLEPVCRDFFRVVALNTLADQAVACAKAAGRMLALVSGGDSPELEPVIAKPLAMAAMTETYKTVCREYAVS